MRAGGRAIDAASSIRYRYSEKPDGTLKYVSKAAYKFAMAHWLKREAIALAASEINQLFPRHQRSLEKKLREVVQNQQATQHDWIIQNAQSVVNDDGYITIDTKQGKRKIGATDAWGRVVPEALILKYKLPNNEYIHVSRTTVGTAVKTLTVQTEEYDSQHIFFFDVCPQISVQSGKNIIQTQVQGRDFSRKEMVSGGDLTFSVSGSIVSHLAALDVKDKTKTESVVQYPENDVQKFIQIMQHKGIIDVNHYLFRQFNVTRIIITDFSLERAEFKNIQPYRFTCVAVEPDEDVIVKQDTIDQLNREIIESPMSKWYKLILNNKLGEIAGSMATDVASNTTSLGLDKLTFGAKI